MSKYIIILAGGAWFAYSLLKKPEWIAILFFTTVIADINFDVPGSPLNFRALLSVILFGKALFLDSAPASGPSFLSTSFSKYIIGFVVYVLIITFSNELLTVAMAKEYLFSLICTYLGYYYFMKEGSYKLFKTSMIISGFICVGDLAWTYMQGGGLWIQRIYFSFLPVFEIVNHNFFGYICALVFVFLLSDYLTKNQSTKTNLFIMPFMFLGVLLSTSRSSLLILIIVSVVLIAKGLLSKQNSSKAYKLVVVSISCLVLTLFLFQILTSVFHIDSEFLEQITGRLIDEPVAIFNRAMGNDFKAESLDSMDWRAEASEIAYNTFMHILTPSEQVFGIGNDGFMTRGLGYMGIYAAHNGILLMMIEYGVVGFIFYHLILISLLTKTISSKYFSPLAICIIYIFLYVTSHNKEMTSLFVFLILGTLAAESVFVPDVLENEDAEIAIDNTNN